MTPQPGLLCVHAHPDDEALFTGGILSRYGEEGARTAVVTCTWREGSRRVAELRRSLGILGAGTPRLLGFDDSGVPGPHPFTEAFDEAVGRLVAQIREFRPEVVVTYDAFGSYGHLDHIHAHRVTLAAVEAAGYPQLYPEAGPPWRAATLYQATYPRSAIEDALAALGAGTPPPPGPGVPGVADERVAVAVDVRPWLDRKWSALLAHESEIERGAGAARFIALPEDVRVRLLGTEWFLRTDLTAPTERATGLTLGRPLVRA